ncbi:site-specific DNA-methyltransferase [Helicobacter sp. MIT 14-3879]|uniref:site-specific DNA-methyltransferase n=1 Tax=Helicobacter sp. MIT 14-3879 TaxID=2040649 RepID=UPI002163A757|nr:site-specific DNA-methyltransferase [Helicobacter sp. MIT 14-3879]
MDPPYNTGNDSFNYNDNFNHSTWLTFMKNRLEIAREFLRDDGVIFVQCDDNEQAYLKVLMDEIFGRENFITCFVWEKTSNSLSRVRIKTEYILCYEKIKYIFDFNGDFTKGGQDFPILNEVNVERILEFPKNTIIFKTLTGKIEANKFNKMELIDTLYIENGKNKNQIQIKAKFKWTQNKLNEEVNSGTCFIIKSNEFSMRYIRADDREIKISNILNAECGVTTNIKATNEIKALFATHSQKGVVRGFGDKKGDNGSDFVIQAPLVPLKKRDLSQERCDIKQSEISKDFINKNSSAVKFLYDDNIENQMQNTTLFATPKPEALLKRIIEISTKEGDLVMDFFAGSGTTLAVAHKMNRRWIGIEQMDYIKSITKERLKKVVNGEQGGVSKSVGWNPQALLNQNLDYANSFIYFELMPLNAIYKEKILKINDCLDLESIYKDLRQKAFLDYRIDLKEILKDTEFIELDLESKKKFLLKALDSNMDYIPLDDLEDISYEINKETINLNKVFYNEGEDE